MTLNKLKGRTKFTEYKSCYSLTLNIMQINSENITEHCRAILPNDREKFNLEENEYITLYAYLQY